MVNDRGEHGVWHEYSDTADSYTWHMMWLTQEANYALRQNKVAVRVLYDSRHDGYESAHMEEELVRHYVHDFLLRDFVSEYETGYMIGQLVVPLRAAVAGGFAASMVQQAAAVRAQQRARKRRRVAEQGQEASDR